MTTLLIVRLNRGHGLADLTLVGLLTRTHPNVKHSVAWIRSVDYADTSDGAHPVMAARGRLLDVHASANPNDFQAFSALPSAARQATLACGKGFTFEP